MQTRIRIMGSIALLAALPFIQGSLCNTNLIKDSVDTAVAKINESVAQLNHTAQLGITTLGDQSVAWQGTVNNLEQNLSTSASNIANQFSQNANDLEKQFMADVKDLVDHVSTVAKGFMQATQEGFNCQLDIFRSHVKIEVENAVNSFLNKYKFGGINNRPIVPFIPIICSANPDIVDVSKWPQNQALVLSGVDLNSFGSGKPQVVVVGLDNSEVTYDVGNQTTNYRFMVNISAILPQLEQAKQIQVRWNGQRVNHNEIPVTPCGKNGQFCCRNNACRGSQCINGTCGSCGDVGQACCLGNTCNTSGATCLHNLCTSCGAVNQSCCNSITCNSAALKCQNNAGNFICITCGGNGQPCCADNTCNFGSACSLTNYTCASCGGLQQSCCANRGCTFGQCDAQNKCTCPVITPVTPQTKIFKVSIPDLTAGGNVAGDNVVNYNFGGPCDSGYHREGSPQINLSAGSGQGTCAIKWLSSESHDCTAQATLTVLGHFPTWGISCHAVINETTDPPPKPFCPPGCSC